MLRARLGARLPRCGRLLVRRHHLRRRVAVLHHRLVPPARAGAEPRHDGRRPGQPAHAGARAAAGLAAGRGIGGRAPGPRTVGFSYAFNITAGKGVGHLFSSY